MKGKGRGYMLAFFAGICAALAAVSAKSFPSSATVANFATNFLASGIAGFVLFGEPLSSQWFLGACLILLGVFVLSRSSIEQKVSSD